MCVFWLASSGLLGALPLTPNTLPHPTRCATAYLLFALALAWVKPVPPPPPPPPLPSPRLRAPGPAPAPPPLQLSCVPKPDAKTARLRAATEAAGGVWRDVQRLSEAELALVVREDAIDVLVELTGG